MGWYGYSGWDRHLRGLDTFADVERRYETTKPLVSKHHLKEDDIRPIGLRSRKWQRIVKVSKNCYALLSGSEPLPHVHVMERGTTNWRTTPNADRGQWDLPPEQYEKNAAIIWRRHRDGSETVRIHGQHAQQCVSHMAFLRHTLPRGLSLISDSKRGLYDISVQGNTVPLPNRTVLSKWWVERYGNAYRKDIYSTTENGTYVLVRRDTPDDQWEVEHAPERDNRSKYIVDREAKRPYNKAVRELVDWMQIMEPLTEATWQDRGPLSKTFGQLTGSVDLVRDIITNAEHEQRVNFLRWYKLVKEIYGEMWCETPRHVRQRASMTRYVNSMAGFYKK